MAPHLAYWSIFYLVSSFVLSLFFFVRGPFYILSLVSHLLCLFVSLYILFFIRPLPRWISSEACLINLLLRRAPDIFLICVCACVCPGAHAYSSQCACIVLCYLPEADSDSKITNGASIWGWFGAKLTDKITKNLSCFRSGRVAPQRMWFWSAIVGTWFSVHHETSQCSLYGGVLSLMSLSKD